MKIAIIGTYPPRQCGIATFTQDLFRSLAANAIGKHGIFAISDGSEYVFPQEVVFIIDKENINSYFAAAQLINERYDACIIQHEYGIFGGETGKYIIDLLVKLKVPVITNLHTVLQAPHSNEYRILNQLAKLSTKITVMTQKAVEMLENIFHIDKEAVSVIPHGVPRFDGNQSLAKKKLGLEHKKIMLSFGFVGRSKGLETAIKAIAKIQEENFVYIILGSTHPNTLREEGESYRNTLMDLVMTLGIGHKVQFVNHFATEELLKQYLTACDIYVTPYPNENQISSGTLSFALGAGAAVISTPYRYATDLLADNRGLFFPFNDSDALATVINGLLENPYKLERYRNNAAQYGKQMLWETVGKRQLELAENLCAKKASSTICLERDVQKHTITSLFENQNRLSS
ncbi:glycosyltransferase family 4 protein [Sphingobacterium sp. ML3W]|uniref:glycosyltransferase family 4 protein n=1 Tax=Sphingobacterium sp. ML3W TaxID=1538644 RepID=UPI000691C2F9|nr:glycosyltransferase family 4 protein [Sphingobacterium sp. ML3W]